MSEMRPAIKNHQEDITIIEGISDRERAYEITSQGFLIPISDALRKDVDEHIDDAEISFSALDQTRALAGYALYKTFQFEEGSALYLSGVQIAQAAQGRGITKMINRRVIDALNPDYFAFRTQSIRMFRSGTALMSDFYPKLDEDNVQVPSHIESVGNKIAGKIGGSFPISRGYYGGQPLYGERPTHDADGKFYEKINFENGDAILCVGAITRVALDNEEH